MWWKHTKFPIATDYLRSKKDNIGTKKVISDQYYVLWSSFNSFWTCFFMYLFDYTMTEFHFLWFSVCYIIRNVRRNSKNRKPALWDFTGILVRLILLKQSLFLPLLLIICIKVILFIQGVSGDPGGRGWPGEFGAQVSLMS